MTGYAALAERAFKAVPGHGIALIAAKSVSVNELPSIARVLRKGASEVKTSARTAAKSILLRAVCKSIARNVRNSCTKNLIPSSLLNITDATKRL